MKRIAIVFYVLVTIALMIWGYYQAIYVAPNDAMQGEIFRIIYYHVPSASVAFVFFAINLVGSIGYLATRRTVPNARSSSMHGRWPGLKWEWFFVRWC